MLSKDLKIVLQGDAITSNPKIKIACSSSKIATHSRILDHTGCGKTAYDWWKYIVTCKYNVHIS